MSWKSNVTLVMAGLLALLSAACSQDTQAETAIALSIKSDLIAGQELGSVRVRIYEVGVNPDAATAMLEFPPQPVADIARPTLVLKGSRTEVLIVVQGLDITGNAVVVARTRAQFMDGKTYNLPIQLARACRAKNCGEVAGQTCYGEKQDGICEGMCGPIPVGASAGLIEDEDSPLPTASREPTRCITTLPLQDAGPDATLPDSGPRDAGPDVLPIPICQPSTAGALCNLATQCGCGVGESCGADTTTTPATIKCITPGTSTEGMSCTKAAQCSGGLACVGARCTRFCEDNSDCGGAGVCAGVYTSASVSLGFKTCGESCTTNAGCPSTNCCMDGFCQPAIACSSCKAAGQTCTTSTDCCTGAPYCNTSSTGAKTCSATPTTVPTSCVASTSDSACLSCDKSKCCTARDACLSNTSCRSLNTCYGACTSGDATCFSTCDTTYAAGLTPIKAWTQCDLAQCSTQCS